MPVGRVFRQSYTAQHQFRPRFFATPDPITATAAVTLEVVTADAAGTFTDAADEQPMLAPMPMPRTGGTGRTVRLQLTANLGGITAQTSPRVEFADEELIEIL